MAEGVMACIKCAAEFGTEDVIQTCAKLNDVTDQRINLRLSRP